TVCCITNCSERQCKIISTCHTTLSWLSTSSGMRMNVSRRTQVLPKGDHPSVH
ncbi:hypothetical protein PAXRUDRAFT_349512, partial [Paxillus rubicundulus Ve08.2h10]